MNFMKSNHIWKKISNKKLMNNFLKYFVSLLNIWLNRRQLDSFAFKLAMLLWLKK